MKERVRALLDDAHQHSLSSVSVGFRVRILQTDLKRQSYLHTHRENSEKSSQQLRQELYAMLCRHEKNPDLMSSNEIDRFLSDKIDSVKFLISRDCREIEV